MLSTDASVTVRCFAVAALALAAACGSTIHDPPPEGGVTTGAGGARPTSGAGGVAESGAGGRAPGVDGGATNAGGRGGAGSGGAGSGGASSGGRSGGSGGAGGISGMPGMPSNPMVPDGGAGDVPPRIIEESTAPAVFQQNFDALAAESTWLKSCKWNKHVRVRPSCGVGGSNCLRIAHDPGNREPPLFPLPLPEARPPYPAGSTGVCPPYYTNTGTDVVQALQAIPPAEEYTLSYDIFFEAGYDWARAGKLPGLTAQEWDSGCSTDSDGLPTDPGPARWSVRVMWRDLGTTELYVYDQDRAPGACGLRAATPIPFTTGKWIPISVYLRLNSAATLNDGEARLFIDGKVARIETGLRLRAAVGANSLIRNIFISTFYGGNESKRLYCMTHPTDPMYCAVKDPRIEVTWVPKNVSVMNIDNIAVYPGLRIRKAAGGQ